MKRIFQMMLGVLFLSSLAVADVVGPLVRTEAGFPGYAVFQINGKFVKVKERVVLRRGGRDVTEGKVIEVFGKLCMVKFNDAVVLHRGDMLRSEAKPDPKTSRPSLRTSKAPKGVRRTQISRQGPTLKRKKGSSPHVLTPAQLATQSRQSSIYSTGHARSVKAIATQSRKRSISTLGRTISVSEFAKQMNN